MAFGALVFALTIICCGQAEMPWHVPDLPYRIVLEVSPVEGETEYDERPADVELDFRALLEAQGISATPDLGTLRIVPVDVATGETTAEARFAHARTESEVPWRWYDGAIEYDFPEMTIDIDGTDGKLVYNRYPRLGHFYDVLGDWKRGRLAFVARCRPDARARYAAYFDVLPETVMPNSPPPKGWIGDGLQRCAPEGDSSTGLIHTRIDVADWNADGLLDLIVGCARGGLLYYPNLGTKESPAFRFAGFLRTTDSLPIDTGWSSPPHVVDWDRDGRPDLLAAGEWNRVIFLRNVGEEDGEPRLENMGFVCTSDGQPLQVPWEPCPEPQPHFTYTRDYYSVLQACDWDGDGDLDLLAGGYVTGRIFLFENAGGPAGVPQLRFVGAVEADGEPIDVGWTAAPSVADIDNDGDLDLVTGRMPMTPGGGDSATSEGLLLFYRNVGSATEPRLVAADLPKSGTFPTSALSTPRFADWSGDGVIDLVMSAGTNIYLYRNAGTAEAPQFEVHDQALQGVWSAAMLPATQLIDWDGDGLLDAVSAPQVRLNLGKGYPGVYGQAFSVLADGQTISHKSGVGDDWVYQRLFDLDGDGELDLMDADHGGQIWFHENRGSNATPDIAMEGLALVMEDGAPLVVARERSGFNALQGARATYAVADFNADGRPDIVTCDTYGDVVFYQRTQPSDAAPAFRQPVKIANLGIYSVPCATDWDGDGLLDVVAAANSDSAVFIRGTGITEALFAPAERLVLPTAPFGAGAPLIVADFNGDGDRDIILQTPYGYACFYEHSFIYGGYAAASVIALGIR